LREYLDRGGFLFVDDFRTAAFSRQTGGAGEDDIGHFRREVKKMYPDRDFCAGWICPIRSSASFIR